MKPDDQLIEKFQKIYFEEYGEEISKEEAHRKFLRLANFLRVVLQPLPSSVQCGTETGSSLPVIDENCLNGNLKKQK